MCDFHLKDNCFHPEKVQQGLIAIPCNVHTCSHCTNSTWQLSKINEETTYHTELIELANQRLPSFNMTKENPEEAKTKGISTIFK